MSTGDLAALAGALGWAISGVLIKSATVRVPAVQINAVYIFLTASLGLVVAAAAGNLDDVFSIGRGDSVFLLVGALLGTSGDLALLRSITIGDLGRNFTTATAIFVVGSTFGGWLILDESVSGFAWGGSLLIVGGVYLTNVPAGAIWKGMAFPAADHHNAALSAPGLAVAAGLFWAVSLLFIDQGVEGHAAIAANGLSNLAPLVLYALIILAWTPARPFPMARIDGLRVAGAGLLFGASILSFLFALELSEASSTAILISSSPLFLVPLSVWFFKERLTPRASTGVALTLAGVFLVVGPG